MAKQKSKVELLKDIRLERRGLEKILSSLPQDKITQGGVVGELSGKDILAHLAAWEQQFLNCYES